MYSKNFKKAFTMIELVFVIVIIGILASVALPKLAATRDDAKIVPIITNIRTLLQDIEGTYTTKGRAFYITAKTPQITDVPLYLDIFCRTRASITQINFVGSTSYLCSGSDAVMMITTTSRNSNIQTVTLKQRITSTVLSSSLSVNKIFLDYTHGIAGNTRIIGGVKVVP